MTNRPSAAGHRPLSEYRIVGDRLFANPATSGVCPLIVEVVGRATRILGGTRG
jgi:hypothetical protein